MLQWQSLFRMWLSFSTLVGIVIVHASKLVSTWLCDFLVMLSISLMVIF
jgi:hypothetical protein